MRFSVRRVLAQAPTTIRTDLRRLRLVRAPSGAEQIKAPRAIRTAHRMGFMRSAAKRFGHGLGASRIHTFAESLAPVCDGNVARV